MKNNLLSETLAYSGKNAAVTQLHLCAYTRQTTKNIASDDPQKILTETIPEGINWIRVAGLRNAEAIKTICDHFAISFLTVQDILNPLHQTKVEDNGHHLMSVMRIFRNDTTDPYKEFLEENVYLILGENFVLTFMDSDNGFFDGVADAIRNDVFKIRSRRTDYLFSVLLNSIIADNVSKAMHIDDMLEDVGSELMGNEPVQSVNTRLQSLRRQYIQMRQGLQPMREQFNIFFHSDNPSLHKDTRPFFVDVNDHLQLTFQTLEICRETFASLTDLYVNNNDMRLNAIMKRLTIVSTIFIPLTFLTSVWGMNFDFMPELKWHYGYLFAWIAILAIGAGIGIFFRGKKWN